MAGSTAGQGGQGFGGTAAQAPPQSGSASASTPPPTGKQPDTVVDVALTLEELYTGTSKKIKISRNETRASGAIERVGNVHELTIKPGYKAGTKIRYHGLGKEAPGKAPGDVVFVVQEKTHDRFIRVGNNLEMLQLLSLADALSGSNVTVSGIDGRQYRVDCPEIITPETVKVITGAGMPLPNSPGQRGDLIVKFRVAFPTHLEEDTRARLKELLS